MVEHSTQIYSRRAAGLMGASMARPYKKVAQMYLGSYCVSNFDQTPHCKPWAMHDANMEDGDEILMEGFTNLACDNLPLYGTLNRGYFGIGRGSDHPVREVYGARHWDWLIARQGANGLVIAGTSGQFIALKDEERLRPFRLARSIVRKRVPVIFSAGHHSTKLTIQFREEARSAGRMP